MWFSPWTHDKYIQDLRELSLRLNFSFAEGGLDLFYGRPFRIPFRPWKEDPLLRTAGFLHLPLFTRPMQCGIGLVLKGNRDGGQVILCGYGYQLGLMSSHWSETLILLEVPGHALPFFDLRPSNLLSPVPELRGGKRVQFPHHTEFSRRYLMRAQLEEAVRTLFSPSVVSHFETDSLWDWFAQGGRTGWLSIAIRTASG